MDQSDLSRLVLSVWEQQRVRALRARLLADRVMLATEADVQAVWLRRAFSYRRTSRRLLRTMGVRMPDGPRENSLPERYRHVGLEYLRFALWGIARYVDADQLIARIHDAVQADDDAGSSGNAVRRTVADWLRADMVPEIWVVEAHRYRQSRSAMRHLRPLSPAMSEAWSLTVLGALVPLAARVGTRLRRYPRLVRALRAESGKPWRAALADVLPGIIYADLAQYPLDVGGTPLTSDRFEAWVRRIGNQLAHERSPRDQPLTDEVAAAYPDPDPLPGDELMRAVERGALMRHIAEARLPSRQMWALRCAVLGLNSDEIAAAMQISPSTARVHLGRARDKIRKIIRANRSA